MAAERRRKAAARATRVFAPAIYSTPLSPCTIFFTARAFERAPEPSHGRSRPRSRRMLDRLMLFAPFLYGIGQMVDEHMFARDALDSSTNRRHGHRVMEPSGNAGATRRFCAESLAMAFSQPHGIVDWSKQHCGRKERGRPISA